MFNCSSNAMPSSSCSPPCGGSLPLHGTCAGPLPGGYIRPDRHGDHPDQPHPQQPPKIKDPGSHVKMQFNEIYGCDPIDYGKPGCYPGAESGTLPELVTRPVPGRTWTEWYMGLENSFVAAIDESLDRVFGNSFGKTSRSGKRVPPPEPGLGGLVMIKFGNHPTRQAEIFKRHIDHVAGKQALQLIPTPEDPENSYPFLRNLAIEANGVLLINGDSNNERYKKTAGLIAAHCERKGIPHRRLPDVVNLANVQYLPSRDLLVIASSNAFYFSKSRRDMLQAEFGGPKHVIHIELDAARTNEHGGMSCYDLDMGLHLTRNVEGQPVALIYPDCIRAHPDLASSGRREFLLVLHELGIRLVELSESDQLSMAANSVSWGLPPGQILLPSRHVSGKLKSELEAAGMKPRFPRGDLMLGARQASNIYYGIHCMTLHLPQAADSDSP